MLHLQSIATKSGHNETCGIHFKHSFQCLTLLHDIDSVDFIVSHIGRICLILCCSIFEQCGGCYEKGGGDFLHPVGNIRLVFVIPDTVQCTDLYVTTVRV